MRRSLLLLFVGASFVLACSHHDDVASGPDADTGDVDTRPPTPAEWDRAITRPDDATASASRAACKFARGALPGETLGASSPVDKDIPIETIVVMMQENRSFDSYFAHLNKFASRTDIESAPDSATNPDKVGGGSPDAGSPDGGAPEGGTGAAHPFQHAPHLCVLDTNHEWNGSHLEYDDGKMDGFYQANQGYGTPPPAAPPSAGDGERALWWLDERDIPFYYALASTYGIGDHYFSSLLGPTWPNRMYLYSATSFGLTYNSLPDTSAFPYPASQAIVFDELEKRHVSWNIYTAGAPGAAVVLASTIINRYGRNPVSRPDDFFAQAAAGTLPQVVFVEAHLGAEGPAQNDEHPPADAEVGQKYVSDVLHALWKGPQWSHMAFFLTYDEHGGFYDHLAPPSACAPDTTPPQLGAGDTTPGAFDRLGVRVPLIVVSPYAKKGFVSHVVHDHTSITRFIETKFKLPALSARDANADPLLEFFDFANPPFLTPPDIAAPTVDPVEQAYCTSSFSK